MGHNAVVVTSISGPNEALRTIAAGAQEHGWSFTVIGDVPSPADFALAGCDFYSLDRQGQTGFRYAELCPLRHYARKNIGYLVEVQRGAEVIVDTDDDNLPHPGFWASRDRRVVAPLAVTPGWFNVYAVFSDMNVWPRGFPLEEVRGDTPSLGELTEAAVDAPIQQGLADENPDVDAVYRLTLPLPVSFAADRHVALAPGVWCPFNSQNTVWWADAFPLLYLPAYCSFRMTDIWRSFVAQRIAWENQWHVLFYSPTVWQERNEHNLMRDFKDEIPGYLNNAEICRQLGELSLRAGCEHLGENVRLCYERLVEMELVGAPELELLDAWLADLAQARSTSVDSA